MQFVPSIVARISDTQNDKESIEDPYSPENLLNPFFKSFRVTEIPFFVIDISYDVSCMSYYHFSRCGAMNISLKISCYGS